MKLAHGWTFCSACNKSFRRADNLRRHCTSNRHAVKWIEASSPKTAGPYPLPNVITPSACFRALTGAVPLDRPSDRSQASNQVEDAGCLHVDNPQHILLPVNPNQEDYQDPPGDGPTLPELTAADRKACEVHESERVEPLSWEVEDTEPFDDAPESDQVAGEDDVMPDSDMASSTVCHYACHIGTQHAEHWLLGWQVTLRKVSVL